MQLVEPHVDAYIALIGAQSPARFRQHAHLAHHRIALDAAGALQAALWVDPLHDQLTLLRGPYLRAPDVPPAVAAALLEEAFLQAQATHPPRIATRILQTVDSADLRAALTAAGFLNKGERVEFTAAVQTLPDDAGTPLRWADLDAVGMAVAASTLAAVSQGDPHGLDAGEDPAQVLTDYLHEAPLNGSPDCVQVGFVDQTPVALVCAQVNPATGWSRITYMGLVPAMRGQGWGRWVHRHGFVMLNAQRGTRYHGGTAAENQAMVRLFVQSGCQELRRMAEWVWHRPCP